MPQSRRRRDRIHADLLCDTYIAYWSEFFGGIPVFTNVNLADEINRTPPKTQAALLEVIQEKQVTHGGETK